MNAPQPGWYQDPSNGEFLRFFDGQQWTSLSHPVPHNGQPTPEMETSGHQHMASLHGGAPMSAQGFQGQNQNHAPSGYSGQNQTPSYAGAGFIDPSDQKPKTSSMVWIIMAAAFVGILVIAIIAMVTTGGGSSGSAGNLSQDYKKLNLGSGYDCEDLAGQVLGISEESSYGDDVITNITDTSMSSDSRSSFEVPSSSLGGYATAFECQGTATYPDGAEQSITYELSVDSDKELWVYYDEKY